MTGDGGSRRKNRMQTMRKSIWDDFFDADAPRIGLPPRRDYRPQKRAGLLRGCGNVYHDLGHANADIKQFKALLAAADFSRIRNGDLGRFTLDRLMSIINRLGSRVEVKLKVTPAGRAHQAAAA